MSSLLVTPILISAAIVLVAYLMKKDEQDPSKQPNYMVLFMVCIVISGFIVYMTSSGNEDGGVNIVMKEIDGGECPF